MFNRITAHIFRILPLIALLLAACAPDSGTATPLTPVPTAEGVRLSSDFPGEIFGIAGSPDGYVLNDSRICLAMVGDAFWEQGDYWDSPDDLPHMEVRLNDQPMTLQLAMIPPIIQIGDGHGGTIGSTPTNYTYCFPTDDLGSGRYTVDIVATSNSGYVQQYTWDLIVN